MALTTFMISRIRIKISAIMKNLGHVWHRRGLPLVKCAICSRKIIKYEEKETAVFLALKLLEIFMADECDIAIAVSHDTDIAAAVKSAKRIFQDQKTIFALPHKRKK